MNFNILNHAIVGAWKNPLSVVPVFEPDFCKALFDDPAQTTFNFNAVNNILSIFRVAPAPYSRQTHGVIISANTIQISAIDLNGIGAMVIKVRDKLKTYFPDLVFEFNPYSITVEYEFPDVSESINAWMEEKFFKPTFTYSGEMTNIKTEEIRFSVSSGDRNFAVDIQPRLNNDKALYLGVTEYMMDDLTESNIIEIQKEVTKTKTTAESNIFNLLNI